MKTHMLAGIALALVTAASAQAEEWVQKSGEVQYRIIHKLHAVDGKSSKVEAIAVLGDAGLKVMARAPVASFDSGNGNRDAHMLEAVEAGKYPYVVVRLLAPGFVLPPAPQKVELPVQAEVELHGVKVRQPVTLSLERVDERTVNVRFAFPTSLTAHKVERPSLLFVKVNDDLQISGAITMERKS